MKTVGIALAALFGLLLLVLTTVGAWATGVNNSMVSMNENVNEKWSQVENVYQRRSDLIPNLVSTVKGYAKHEASVLEEVAKARASAGQVKVNAANSEDLAKYEHAQTGVTQALSRLMVISERYPELKADKQFIDLQSQIEGTENRIAVARRDFNIVAREYNTYIKSFPSSLIASFRNFKERAYFQAEATAKTAPKVEF